MKRCIKQSYRISLFIISIAILSACDSGRTIEKPNILLIVSEDNGPDLGCYGNPYVTTPNLDKLADSGVKFDRAFVTYSVCSPSRATIFTGLYPHQNGQIGLATHKFKMYRPFKTMPVYLKEVGYRTGCLGKIHVNPESAIPWDFHPLKGSNFSKTGLPEYATKAREFIDRGNEPFFLMVNFPDAHYPVQPQVEGMPKTVLTKDDIPGALAFVGANSDRLKEYTANYYNCINRLDESVGLLLAELELSGKAENTAIIYLGDHGAQFSRGKCSNYEGALSIPFIMRLPKQSKRDTDAHELITTVDLLPTVLELAGLNIPKELPGESLVPLYSQAPEKWRNYVFADGEGSAAFFYFPRRSVRGERYKLIHNMITDRENPKYYWYTNRMNDHFSGGTGNEEIIQASEEVQQAYRVWQSPPEFEMYDLENDPYEFRNLSGCAEYEEILEILKMALKQWQKETIDPLADRLMLAKLTFEMDSIVETYRENNYAKDPDFNWGYTNYLYEYIQKKSNGNQTIFNE